METFFKENLKVTKLEIGSFRQKIRQIEGSYAALPRWNVNKLSRFFLLFLTFRIFFHNP